MVFIRMGRHSGSYEGRRSPRDVAFLSSQGAGASEHREVRFLVIGRVVAPRGVRGELKVAIQTDTPERFLRTSRVFLGEERRVYTVRSARLHQGHALVRLAGIETRNDAEPWRDAYVYVALEDAIPLEEDEYYHHQIEGLRVRTTKAEDLGRVVEVLQTGANDVWVVRGRGGEVLIPALKDVILGVDLDAGVVTVALPEGLRCDAVMRRC
jgi:16S rRNA processing protein RimM